MGRTSIISYDGYSNPSPLWDQNGTDMFGQNNGYLFYFNLNTPLVCRQWVLNTINEGVKDILGIYNGKIYLSTEGKLSSPHIHTTIASVDVATWTVTEEKDTGGVSSYAVGKMLDKYVYCVFFGGALTFVRIDVTNWTASSHYYFESDPPAFSETRLGLGANILNDKLYFTLSYYMGSYSVHHDGLVRLNNTTLAVENKIIFSDITPVGWIYDNGFIYIIGHTHIDGVSHACIVKLNESLEVQSAYYYDTTAFGAATVVGDYIIATSNTTKCIYTINKTTMAVVRGRYFVGTHAITYAFPIDATHYAVYGGVDTVTSYPFYFIYVDTNIDNIGTSVPPGFSNSAYTIGESEPTSFVPTEEADTISIVESSAFGGTFDDIENLTLEEKTVTTTEYIIYGEVSIAFPVRVTGLTHEYSRANGVYNLKVYDGGLAPIGGIDDNEL